MLSDKVVDDPLEGCGGIGQSEEQVKILERTVMGSEGSFPFFPFCNPDEIECTTLVNLSEDLGSI